MATKRVWLWVGKRKGASPIFFPFIVCVVGFAWKSRRSDFFGHLACSQHIYNNLVFVPAFAVVVAVVLCLYVLCLRVVDILFWVLYYFIMWFFYFHHVCGRLKVCRAPFFVHLAFDSDWIYLNDFFLSFYFIPSTTSPIPYHIKKTVAHTQNTWKSFHYKVLYWLFYLRDNRKTCAPFHFTHFTLFTRLVVLVCTTNLCTACTLKWMKW